MKAVINITNNLAPLSVNILPKVKVFKTLKLYGRSIKVEEEYDFSTIPEEEHGVFLQLILKL